MKLFILVLVVCFIPNDQCKNLQSTALSRRKRYLTFPEGASLSVAICMTAQMGITPGQIFTEAINWGINYDLPNDTSKIKDFLPKSKQLMKRRNRRDLYSKMEVIMNSMGYNGRSCILRTLCEASHQLRPRAESLVDEILNIVFGYPLEKIQATEPEEHKIYHWASTTGKNSKDQECAAMFSDCPISLIDMALGYYSNGYI